MSFKAGYEKWLDDTQKVDVLKFISEGYCYLVVRSSGIEPNLKINITVNAADKESAMAMETAISK